jgi:hypothetical protein
MRIVAIAALFLAVAGQPARADPASSWQAFIDSDGPTYLEDSDWHEFTRDYRMDIGHVASAAYAVAWREGSDVGAFLHYRYDPPVSPPELPKPGPLTDEYVEVTLHCASGASRIHHMYLFAAGRSIGGWFDPASAANPTSYGSQSLIGLAAARAC